MFIEASFTIAKNWKQPMSPLMGEWIENMWQTYRIEYYSVINRKEITPFVTIWMEFEGI